MDMLRTIDLVDHLSIFRSPNIAVRGVKLREGTTVHLELDFKSGPRWAVSLLGGGKETYEFQYANLPAHAVAKKAVTLTDLHALVEHQGRERALESIFGAVLLVRVMVFIYLVNEEVQVSLVQQGATLWEDQAPLQELTKFLIPKKRK